MSELHPELVAIRRMPRFSWNPLLASIMRHLKPKPLDPGPDITVKTITVPGPAGAPEVTLRVFQPATPQAGAASPALFWIHGGGMIGGTPEQDDRSNIDFVRELGITVAAVRYRLAPQHRAPAAIEDVYAGLVGLAARAAELGIDAGRIAIGGASAGGGLSAALAQVAHDRGAVKPIFQLLVYPMLDDRTTKRPASDFPNVRVWTWKSNVFGWKSYLGPGFGGPDISSDAAPARREDLAGLPPAWVGVGSLDLFFDEDLDYARRLAVAGVATEVVTVPGAFHGFDAVYPRAEVSRTFWRRQLDALRIGLGLAQ